MKYASLSLLEPSGLVQACTGIALPFTFYAGMHNSVMLVKFVIESVFFIVVTQEFKSSYCLQPLTSGNERFTLLFCKSNFYSLLAFSQYLNMNY